MTLLSDLGIAVFCLGSSAYLYFLHHRRTSTFSSRTALPASGYVLTNQVIHARLLPAESKHAFTYPTLSLLLSLSALETGTLNRGWRGVVFGYPGLWRICGLRPQTYLTDCTGSSGASLLTIREKLVQLLKPSDIRLGEVWMMTMPSFLGFEGINPLTVYFCYEEGQETVWGVILEVHNTFGERHAYVLQVGKGEDEGDGKTKGYDHQWTFPRQFHVSPFNDRSGHYVCSVVMPTHPPPSAASPTTDTPPPRPIINLHLLTAPPSPQLKLTALLRPVVSEPLTARSLLGALILPPFTSSKVSQDSSSTPSPASWSSLPLGAALLLTAVRIVYHAARLHYQRGLAVFARPEPTAGLGRQWVEKALGEVWNDVQPTTSSQDESTMGGSIGWQAESSAERWARQRFEARFGMIAAKTGVSIKIASVDPSIPITILGPAHATDGKSTRELVLCYRSPRTWTSMLLAPTAKHALELGSRAEKWFAVSDEQLLASLWDNTSSTDSKPSWISTFVETIRRQLAYILTTALAFPSLPSPPYPPHPLDSPPSIVLLFHMGSLYLTFHVERLVFDSMRARFVRGDVPWRVWDRVGRKARIGAGGIGSVKE
ncbi:hypothetical protein FRC07_003867 [Ceratobasidium sp. 392]|nr:hypothetical protein FRC07_003867 [Ceratobasidium sp. 392]